MENRLEHHSDAALVGMIDAALTALTDGRLRLSNDEQRLQLLSEAVRLGSRVQAWQQALAAGIEADEVALRAYNTPTGTWLADATRLTRREAQRLVKAGQGLAQFPTLGAAALRGEVLAGQAESITSVLADLPRDLEPAEVARGERHLIELAQTHNSAELRRLSGHLLEVLAPETADALEGAALQRQLKRAQAGRFLDLRDDGQGSTVIRGSLPTVDAEPFRLLLDSYAAQLKRGFEALDPLQPAPTAGQRRAEALTRLVDRHQQLSLAPVMGGDRPRIVVTVSYDKLRQQAVDAGLLGTITATGARVCAHTVRRLLCDAEVLPVVLGGPSQILDVGRAERLVTPPMRVALHQRDQGCVFPGWDTPPEACHAHHIVPWLQGGPTALSNLVLLCPHHHALIEPGSDPAADRWSLTLRDDGVSEIRPPRRADKEQRPRVHARFLTRRRT
ncbi:DUF222 domain-containing protein [Micropruina sp.]|uniref:DUF222 domain-containing protein n=1 Tax=Micropruina sp. TaxID=2737536 RepID=UPI0039E297CC